MPEETPTRQDATPKFLDVARKDGNTVYLNLLAIAHITIPGKGNDPVVIKMVTGEEFLIDDSADRLLMLISELSSPFGNEV